MNNQSQKTIQNTVLNWYKKAGRHTLPWRHTTDLYKITVAEIMLQQTNVPKVIERYTQFLQKFPTWHQLAQASTADVLKTWQGLGYNRRALYLHKMAKIVVEKYSGVLPENPELLKELPGMGPYTSIAVLVFGRNTNHAAVDVNISRVIRRWYGQSAWSPQDALQKSTQFIPKGKSRDWHNALMDFASVICKKKNPTCVSCPLAANCQSYPKPLEEFVKKRLEPGRMESGKHIPRRIFRGRTVECLRQNPASLTNIGRSIKTDWQTKKDAKWLESLLIQLQKEGMVQYTNKKWQLKI